MDLNMGVLVIQAPAEVMDTMVTEGPPSLKSTEMSLYFVQQNVLQPFDAI